MKTPAVVALALIGGCSSSKAECSCAPTGIELRVPEARAADVLDVTLSGAACANVHATCTSFADGGTGCTRYRISPNAVGYCDIDVDFRTGAPRFSATVKVAQVSSCCSGLYPDPISAGQVEVPG